MILSGRKKFISKMAKATPSLPIPSSRARSALTTSSAASGKGTKSLVSGGAGRRMARKLTLMGFAVRRRRRGGR